MPAIVNKARHAARMNVLIFGGVTILLSFATYLLPLPRTVLPFIIVLLPAPLALLFALTSAGPQGVRMLIGKVGQWRISPKWLAIALLLALTLRVATSVVALWLGWIPALHLRLASPDQLLTLATILLVAALPEELGWRGYALPKLFGTYSALVASLIIGVMWGTLHLALILPEMMNAGTSPVATMLYLIAMSVLITWLYVNSGGSIMITTIFHAAQSFFVIVNEGIPLAQQLWLMAGVCLVMATILVVITGPRLASKDAQLPSEILTPGFLQ